MSKPNARSQLLTLSLGLFLGAVLGAGGAKLTSASPLVSIGVVDGPHPSAGLEPSTLSGLLDHSETTMDALRSRTAELEAALALTTGGARYPIPTESDVDAPFAAESQPAVRDYLHELIDRGILIGGPGPYHDAVAWEVTSALREEGRFAEALEVAEGLGTDSSYMLQRIGQDALDGDDEQTAAAAFASALRLDVLNVQAIEGLIETDPSSAVEVFQESLSWQDPPGSPLVRRNLAQALGAKGDLEGAREVISSLEDQGLPADELAEAWKGVDSEEYERILRAEYARDAGGWGRAQLAALLSGRGEDAEATKLYRRMLEDEPGEIRAFKELFKLDPLQAEGLMRGHIALNPDQSWKGVELALQLDGIGREHDAIELMLQDFPERPWGRGYKYLMDHAPGRAAQALEANLDEEDGYAVGTYANVLWQTGRTEEAVQRWNQAWKLEPYDEEWYGRLLDAANGRDPFE